MKIALTTIGSRGDIQPCIALGKALQKNGYNVTILTHPWANKLLNSYNLKHIPIGKEIDIHAAAKRFVENSTGNIKGLLFALNFIFIQLRECHTDLLEAIKDFDLVIGHGIVGNSEADILKKPFISISIETMGLQKEYWRSKNFFKELGVFIADQLKGFLLGGPYKKFRKEIGAPPVNERKEYPHLALIPVSPQIQKSNRYWKPITEITGFFLADTPDAFVPPKRVKDFIGAGEKPLFISFGSMFHTEQKALELYHIIAEAVANSKSRAILLMADLDMINTDIPDYICPVKNVSYRWLLKHISLVVHHFGFGTTAEVLHAGLASIPIPHIFDQRIRANQMHKLGLTHNPLNLITLNSEKLADAIKSVKADTELKTRCEDIGKKISMENGLAKAVELINKFY